MLKPLVSGILAGGIGKAVARTLLSGMVLTLVAGGLAACGKRGDPYRPSEVPAPEKTEKQS